MSEIIAFIRDLPKTATIDVDALRADSVDAQHVNFSWAPETSAIEREDGWSFSEALSCEHCGAVYVSDSPVECDNTECEHFGEEIAWPEGPMMNYYYPLPFEPSEQAIAELAELPLCVVYVDEDPALALTGGGMDLSWEICEAFMRLDCLPPLEYAGVPAMAGRGDDADDLRIILACERSVEAAREIFSNRCNYAARKIQETVAFAKRYREEQR